MTDLAERVRDDIRSESVRDVGQSFLLAIGFSGLGCIIGVFVFARFVEAELTVRMLMQYPDVGTSIGQAYRQVLLGGVVAAGVGLSGGVWLGAENA